MKAVSIILLAWVLAMSAAAAPLHPDIEPDLDAPAEDLICEVGSEVGNERVDPTLWTGCFGGVGITIGLGGDTISAEPIKDGPAAKAGMGAGEQILKINDESASGLDLDQAKNRLRGSPGSVVTLTMLLSSTGEIKTRRIQRALIKLPTIRDAQVLSGKVGYVRITNFNRFTGSDLRSALEQLYASGARGWIIDLRGNRGGLIRGARDATSRFVEPSRVLMMLQMPPPAPKQEFFPARFGPRTSGPLTVLVNSGTGGAAELMAEALRLHRHAMLIGAKTAGFSHAARFITLQAAGNAANSSLVDAGECFAASGVAFGGVGLKPDIMLTGNEDVGLNWQRQASGAAMKSEQLMTDAAIASALSICLRQLGLSVQ